MANDLIKRCLTSWEQHKPLGKWKLKPWRDITTHILEQTKQKIMTMSNADKDIEKRNLSHWWWEDKTIQPLWKIAFLFYVSIKPII